MCSQDTVSTSIFLSFENHNVKKNKDVSVYHLSDYKIITLFCGLFYTT